MKRGAGRKTIPVRREHYRHEEKGFLKKGRSAIEEDPT